MQSKFHNDFDKESKLHKLLIRNGIVEKLSEFGLQYINEDITKKEQNLGIDFRCHKWNETINIDEKCRFTLPLNNFEIKYTFSLELLNCNSWKRWWFVDKEKETDYYLLLYPVLSWELPKWISAYNYQINDKGEVIWTGARIMGVMWQLVSVSKLRRYIEKIFSMHELSEFVKKFKSWKINGEGTLFYWSDYQPIMKWEKKSDIYFSYSIGLNEKPLNFILKQNIYTQLREFEFDLEFTN